MILVRTMPIRMTTTEEPPIKADDLRICEYDFCIGYSPCVSRDFFRSRISPTTRPGTPTTSA